MQNQYKIEAIKTYLAVPWDVAIFIAVDKDVPENTSKESFDILNGGCNGYSVQSNAPYLF